MASQPDLEAAAPAAPPSKPPFLRRVRIRGYKSIAFCDVTLEPLTVFVGRNASGKSNFLDALAFLRDVVVKGVQEAVKLHGGRDAILCRFSQSSTVAIGVEAEFIDQESNQIWTGELEFSIDFPPLEVPRLVHEHGRFQSPQTPMWRRYMVENGVLRLEDRFFPPNEFVRRTTDRLYAESFAISAYSGWIEHLETIGCHSFNPEAIRRPQKPAPGEFLGRDGSNLASVIETTKRFDPQAIERAARYLQAITCSVEYAGVLHAGGYETLRFRVSPPSEGKSLDFDAASMSDGTLRAFAALIAAFQRVFPEGSPSVVGIEEPETALHPAATRALVDALDEATLRTQILLTTHSADMLDNPTIRPENVRVVQMIDGQTVIGTVDEASVDIVRRNLNTLGGLERDNLLEPNLADLDRQRQAQQETPA